MKVLLTKNVPGLGKAGDIKEVSDGHARNFLIPRHLALPATSSVLQRVQKEELEHQAKLKRQVEQFQQLSHKIENKVFTIKARADKHHLFAAIKESEIAQVIKERIHLDVIADQITMEKAIKTLGPHEAFIRLAGNPPIKVNLNIEQI